MKKKKKFNSYSPVITLPAILVYTSFLIMPLIISFIFSFSDWNVVSWETPEFNGLTNYKEILADPIFTRSLLNTFVNAFGTAILKIVLGILLALPLSKAFKRKWNFQDNILCTVCNKCNGSGCVIYIYFGKRRFIK